MTESRLLHACLLWLSLLGAAIANIQPIFLGALAESFSLSAQQLGFVGGIELAGVGLASLGAAFWFPRANLRRFATGTIFCTMICNLLTTWAVDYSVLLALRFINGFLGTGVIYTIALGLIGQTRNPDRLIAIAVVSQILFAAIAMPVIPTLLAYWHLPGMTFGLLALYSTGLLTVTRIPQRAVDKVAQPVNLNIGSPRWTVPTCLLGGLLVFSIGIGSVWAFLERIGDTYGFAMSDIGGALAMTGLIGGLGALLAAVLGQSLGRKLPVVAATGGLLLSCLLLYTHSDWRNYILAVSIFCFCWNLALPYLLGSIAAMDQSGSFTVLIPAAQAGGYALGPTLAGLFIVNNSYPTVALFSIAAFFLCLVLVIPILSLMGREVRPS